ncbi:MAG: hypothetical protein QW775_01175 [Ignisphaera sp.]
MEKSDEENDMYYTPSLPKSSSYRYIEISLKTTPQLKKKLSQNLYTKNDGQL